MARINLSRFCRPELLKQVDPALLRRFLSKVDRGYVSTSPALIRDPIDYTQVAERLGTPNSQYPEDLVEALYYADDFSRHRSAFEELRVLAEGFLAMHPPEDAQFMEIPPTGAGVVMWLWLADEGPELVKRAHAEHCFVQPRSFESFYPSDEETLGAPEMDEAARKRAEDYLSRYYYRVRTSSSRAIRVSVPDPAQASEPPPNMGVQVIMTSRGGDAWFMVRKPESWERRTYIAHDGGEDVKQGFPEGYRVVIFCAERSELSVHAESKGELEALREAFGLALFRDAYVFSTTGRVTLEPLRTQAREILRCDDIPGISAIELVELEFRYRNPNLGSTIRRAPDLLEVFTSTHPMPKAEIRKAVFNVRFEQSERFHPVRIYAGSRTAYAREHADKVIKLWMHRRSLLNRQVRLEQEQVADLWATVTRLFDAESSMESWRHATGTLWGTFEGYLKPTTNAARHAPCGRREIGCSRTLIPSTCDETVQYRCEQDPARCDAMEVSWQEARGHVLDMDRLANQLARTVEADEVARRHADAETHLWKLGRRSLGGVDVQIWFTPQAEDEPLCRALQVLEVNGAGASAPALLLCPGCASVSTRTLELGQKRKVSVMGLDEVTTWSEEGPEVDLWPFILAHRERLGALDPTEFCGDRYDLILDPSRGRYWLYRRLADMDPMSKPILLLKELAKDPGQIVRFAEMRARYPDQFVNTAKSTDRGVVTRLNKLFGGGMNLPQAPTPVGESGGGYVLKLPQDRILWWSRA